MLGMMAVGLMMSEGRAEEEPLAKVAVDARPKFSDFTEAGVRLLNPPANQFWVQPSLQGESIEIILTRGDVEMPKLKVESFSLGFGKSDLEEPGKYYPPEPAVVPDTPVTSLHLFARIPADEIGPLIDEWSRVLGTDGTKLRVWIENRLWESTGNIQVPGTIPGGSGSIQVGREETSESYSVSIRISWVEEGSEEASPRKVPRPRIVVPRLQGG